MGVSFSHKGDFKKTTMYLTDMKKTKFLKKLNEYGKMGVEALRNATPRRTGLTAESWSYEIEKQNGVYSIYWKNSNMAREQIAIALLIQYGHLTGNGTYIQGIDYINPALKPIFEQIANDAWKEVKAS